MSAQSFDASKDFVVTFPVRQQHHVGVPRYCIDHEDYVRQRNRIQEEAKEQADALAARWH